MTEDHQWRYCGIDPDTSTCAVGFVDVWKVGNQLHGRIHNGWVEKPTLTSTYVKCHHLGFRLDPVLQMKLSTCDGMAIEGQDVIRGHTKNPADIIKLAQVAGFWAAQRRGNATVHVPEPKEWKGQVPKGVHHKRLCAMLGLRSKTMGGKHPYECPLNDDGTPRVNLGNGIVPSDWKHLLDAFGLAIWLAELARGTSIQWGRNTTSPAARFSLDTIAR